MTRTIRPRRPARNRPRFETLESRALLSLAGGIDQSFGTLGIVNNPVVPVADQSMTTIGQNVKSTIAPDGTIVQASSYNIGGGAAYFVIEELNGDGTLKTSFGQGGIATFQVAPQSSGIVSAIVVQPNGTIDVAGGFGVQVAGSTLAQGILEVTPAGTLETSFGNQGMALLPASLTVTNGVLPQIGAMALDSSGDLIVAGSDGNGLFFATAFTPAGTVDTAFGTGGVASFPVTIPTTISNGYQNQVKSIAIQSSGRILIAGNAEGFSGVGEGPPNSTEVYSEVVVAALTTSGTLDTTFGDGTIPGEQILKPADNVSLKSVAAMGVQSTGVIILTGTTGPGPLSSQRGTAATGFLERLTPDGLPNPPLVLVGTTVFPSSFLPVGLAIDATNQIFVNGTYTAPGTTTSMNALALFDARGISVANFGSVATPGLAVYPYNTNVTSFTTPLVYPNTASEQIYLGGSTRVGTLGFTDFSVVRILKTPTPALQQPSSNYDGTNVSNLSVYLPASGAFAYRPSNGGADVVVPFGIPGVGRTIPAPGDYTGAGQTEIAAYLPTTGVYAYRPANGGPDVLQTIGIPGAGQSIPAPGDYFGSGVDDIAVYMPSVGLFGIRPSTGGSDILVPFGTPGIGQSIPAPADYFNTGQTDIAVYLSAIGAFAIRNPLNGLDSIIPFGIAGAGNSIPIPGDYDGSGKTELAVYLPKLGAFAYRPANGGPDVIEAFGAKNDGTVPVPGDYTGVSYDEIAVYDPNFASFAYRPAKGGTDVITSFGTPGIGASLPTSAPISLNSMTTPSTVSAMSVSVGSTAVPAGPKALASTSLLRIASTLPAQADPSKPKA